jgi:hypothetical protein
MDKKPLIPEALLSAGLILLTTILTYGVLIPHLGFYRDDWYMIWTAQSQGPQGVLNLFKGDRPFIGILYAFDYSLLGKTTLYWHLYALIIKLIGGFALLWLLRLIWPEKKVETTFVVLLFMIYPGFYQQANAATFKNLLLSLSAAIISMALTIYSIKTRSIWMRLIAIFLAVVLSAFYLAIYEAMIGLEAARALLVWYVLRRQAHEESHRAVLLGTIKWEIPYLLLAFGFLFWRIFIFNSTRRSTSLDIVLGEYSVSPQHSLIAILVEYVKDIIETTILAWSVPYYNFTQYTTRYRDFGLATLLTFVIAGLSLAYYLWAKRRNWIESETVSKPSVFRDFIILGLLIVLMTTIPIVAAGRNVIFGLQWDRYTAQSTLGAALFMGGLAFFAVRPPIRWVFLLGLLVAGVFTQFYSALNYSDFWNVERSMWWQLTWRVPDFEPGATVIGVAPRGFRYAEEYEVWGPLNIIYSPGGPLKVSGQILYDGLDVDMASGKQEERNNRNILISRDYGKAIIASIPRLSSCVHVINGHQLELPSFEDPAVVAAAPFSRIDLVLTNAKPFKPPVEVFGFEPSHAWCYYYEKMDLARQMQDWQTVIQLGEEAQSIDLAPNDTSEWMPLYIAYINAGESEKARGLVKRIRADREMRAALCLQIEQAQWPASYNAHAIVQTLCGGGN